MMWNNYDGGGNWGAMLAMTVVALAVFAVLALVTVRILAARRAPETAMETLRQRLAAGQVSQEEFDRTKKAILG